MCRRRRTGRPVGRPWGPSSVVGHHAPRRPGPGARWGSRVRAAYAHHPGRAAGRTQAAGGSPSTPARRRVRAMADGGGRTRPRGRAGRGIAGGLAAVALTGLATAPAAPAAGLRVVGEQRLDDRLTELTLRTAAVAGPTRVRVLLPVGYGGRPAATRSSTSSMGPSTTSGAGRRRATPRRSRAAGACDRRHARLGPQRRLRRLVQRRPRRAAGVGGPTTWASSSPCVDRRYRTVAAARRAGGRGAVHGRLRRDELRGPPPGPLHGRGELLGRGRHERPGRHRHHRRRAVRPARHAGGPLARAQPVGPRRQPARAEPDRAHRQRAPRRALRRRRRGRAGGAPDERGLPRRGCGRSGSATSSTTTAPAATRGPTGSATCARRCRASWRASPTRRPRPRGSTFRATEPRFGAYGWRVAMHRPALEFAELRDARRGGFALRGSGTATVTTPPRFTPGQASASASATAVAPAGHPGRRSRRPPARRAAPRARQPGPGGRARSDDPRLHRRRTGVRVIRPALTARAGVALPVAATLLVAALLAATPAARAGGPSCPVGLAPGTLASAATLRALNAKEWSYGPRTTGGPAHRRMVAWLERELRRVPGCGCARAASGSTPGLRAARAAGLAGGGTLALPVAAPVPYAADGGGRTQRPARRRPRRRAHHRRGRRRRDRRARGPARRGPVRGVRGRRPGLGPDLRPRSHDRPRAPFRGTS